uniref:Uncharacterized protein n=2 Tax=Burkholderia sp. M701 TaxID=326454 RepID=V5YNN8_9BURK|nr:hypothetical protein [Burkholderia sp. M701]
MLIERGIRPVCDALNRIEGVRTLWSCEGHPFRLSRPYVVFEAPEPFALRVHRAIEAKHIEGSLNYCWWLTANFRDNGVLQWCIEPNCRIPRWRYLPIARKKLDAELRLLAAALSGVSEHGPTERWRPEGL